MRLSQNRFKLKSDEKRKDNITTGQSHLKTELCHRNRKLQTKTKIDLMFRMKCVGGAAVGPHQ